MKHLILFLLAASLWGQTSGVTTSGNIRSGTGSPESAVSAPVGTVYQRTDGGSGTSLYIKETGSGNTGWVAVAGSGATTASALTDLKLTKTSTSVATIAGGTYAKGNAPRVTFAGAEFTIGSLSISGATNASPIVLTVSSTTGTSLRNGDTVMVSGVGGNTAANGTWIVEVPTSTTIRLIGSTGNGSYTSGGTVAGSGNGTCEFYLTPQGYATADCSSSAGLILTCTGNCVMNQSTTPTPPSDATLSGSMTVTSGAFDTATNNVAAINSGWDVQAGQGISVSPAAGTATVAVDSTVARTSGTNAFTGSNSFTAATRTAPCRTGSGSPSALNGTAGDCYWQTDATAGSNLWWATTTGTPATWTLQAGGSSVSAHDQTRIDEVDEFLSVSTTTGAIGTLGWALANGQGSGSVAYQTNPGTARWGVVRLTTGASNDDNTGLALGGWSAINSTTNWEMQWIVSPVSTTSVQYYVGITNAGSLASNTIGFRFDTGASHTAWQFEACASATCTTTSSGVSVVAGTWYRLRLRTTSSGTYLFSIDGGSETTISTNVPSSTNMRPTAVAHTRTGAAKDLDIDRFSLTRTGISR